MPGNLLRIWFGLILTGVGKVMVEMVEMVGAGEMIEMVEMGMLGAEVRGGRVEIRGMNALMMR